LYSGGGSTTTCTTPSLLEKADGANYGSVGLPAKDPIDAEECGMSTKAGYPGKLDSLSWHLPVWMAEGTKLGDFLAFEVRCQLFVQQFTSLKHLAWWMHWFLKEEVIFVVLPFLVWLLTPRHAINALLCTCLTEYINGVVKWGIAFPRPFWVFKDVENKDNCWEGDFSSPSSHTQLITALLVCFCLEDNSNIPLWFMFSTFCFLTGICRVYVGVHYFHDIVGGWTLGAGTALGWYFVDPLSGIRGGSAWTQFFMFTAIIAVPFIILKLVRDFTPGLSPELHQQYQAQGRSKLKEGFNEKKCVIKTRSLYQYIAPCAVVSGGVLGIIIAKQASWSGYDQICAMSDIQNTVLRALAGSLVQLVMFAIALLVPSELIKRGVPELPCQVGKYIAVMGTAVWLIAWLHWAREVGIPPCAVSSSYGWE